MTSTRLPASLAHAAASLHVALSAAVLAAIFTFTITPAAQAMNIQTIKSPGGIEAWLVEEHSVPLMAMRFAFGGGNSQDPVGREGTANFITAMMDEGAGDLDSAHFQERVEEIAMRMSFDDSKDTLYGSLETLTVNRPKAVELLKLAITKPRFDPAAVDRIRQQLLANLIYSEKDPEKVAAKEWFATAFEGHPYGRPANGTAATVGKISHDDLANFHKRLFARNNLKVVAVGDIDAATFGTFISMICWRPTLTGAVCFTSVSSAEAGKPPNTSSRSLPNVAASMSPTATTFKLLRANRRL